MVPLFWLEDNRSLFLETFSLESIVYVVLKVDIFWQYFSTQLQTTSATAICQTISRLRVFWGKVVNSVNGNLVLVVNPISVFTAWRIFLTWTRDGNIYWVWNIWENRNPLVKFRPSSWQSISISCTGLPCIESPLLYIFQCYYWAGLLSWLIVTNVYCCTTYVLTQHLVCGACDQLQTWILCCPMQPAMFSTIIVISRYMNFARCLWKHSTSCLWVSCCQLCLCEKGGLNRRT